MSMKSNPLRGWVIVGLLFAFMMINYADKAVLGLVALPMMRDMHLSATQFGLLGSAFYALYSLSGVGFGILTRYVKAKWLLFVLALIWAAVQFPVVAPVSFGTLLACRVMLGLGEGPAYAVALHAAYQWFDNDKRNVPTSVIQTGAAAGVMVAAPVLTWITEHYHWRATFLALGLAGLAWAALWLLLGKEGDDRPATVVRVHDTPSEVGRVPYLRLLLDPTVLIVTLQWFLATLITVIALVWGPVYVRAGLGYSARETGWIFALQVAAQVPVGLALNALSQYLISRGMSTRFARGVFYSACCALGALAYLVLLTGASPAVKLAWMTFGFTLIVQINAFGPQLIAEMTPASQRGTLLAASVSIASIAGAIGPVLLGRIMDASGAGRADGSAFTLVYLLIAGALFLSALPGFVWLDPQRSKRRLTAVARGAVSERAPDCVA
jgi:MFS transporter, ACS family, hexuronate transporter